MESHSIASHDEPARGVLDARSKAFLLLLLACCLAAGVGTALDAGRTGGVTLLCLILLVVAPYVLWIVRDLQQRGVRDGQFWFELIVAMVPSLGLLLYLLLSRSAVGFLIWLAVQLALFTAASLGALVGVLFIGIGRAL